VKEAPFTKSQSDLKEDKSSNASSPATDSSPLTITEEVFSESVINTKNEPSKDKELISSTGLDSKKNKIPSKSGVISRNQDLSSTSSDNPSRQGEPNRSSHNSNGSSSKEVPGNKINNSEDKKKQLKSSQEKTCQSAEIPENKKYLGKKSGLVICESFSFV